MHSFLLAPGLSFLVGCLIAFFFFFFKPYFLERTSEIKSISKPDLHFVSKKSKKTSRSVIKNPNISHGRAKDQQIQHHPLYLNTLKGHTDSVSGMCFSLDGRRLATACANGMIRVFKLDNATSKEFSVLTIKLDDGSSPRAVVFSDNASSIIVASIAHNGTTLCMYGEKKLTSSESSQKSKHPPPETKWINHEIHNDKSVVSLVGSASTYGDGNGSSIIVSCSEGTDITLWHGETGKMLKNWDTNQLTNTMAAISPNGRFVAAVTFLADVKIWEVIYSKDGSVKDVKNVMQLKGHKSAVTWLCFAPNSEQIITASKDGTIKTWNINVRYNLEEDPKILKNFQRSEESNDAISHYDRLAMSPDGKILAATHGSTLRWLCAESGKVLDTFENAHDSDIKWISWTPKAIPVGEAKALVLATAGGNKQVKLWRAPLPLSCKP